MKINILDFYIHEQNPARKLFFDVHVPLERFVCPVCENDRESVGYSAVKGSNPNHFLERKLCVRCQHVFTSFGPSLGWHAHYYDSDWYKGKTHGRNTFPGLRRVVKDQVKRMVYGPAAVLPEFDLNVLLAQPFLKPRMKILEIGSGGGRSLLPFKKAGLECYAIEPSANSAQSCREKGIKAFHLSAEEALKANVEIPKMDIILSNHSLEHFADPNHFFQTMKNFLKPDGIVIINVPNKDYVDIYSETLFILHPQVFSEHSLNLLLRKHGFRTVSKIMNDSLVFLARRHDGQIEPEDTDKIFDKGRAKSFYRTLWAQRYQLDRYKGQRLVVEWDGEYLVKGSVATVAAGREFPPKRGGRTFLIEMQDVVTEYAVLFESHIEKNSAFGVIK